MTDEQIQYSKPFPVKTKSQAKLQYEFLKIAYQQGMFNQIVYLGEERVEYRIDSLSKLEEIFQAIKMIPGGSVCVAKV